MAKFCGKRKNREREPKNRSNREWRRIGRERRRREGKEQIT